MDLKKKEKNRYHLWLKIKWTGIIPLATHNIESVLWREEAYTMKYSLSPREIPRAKSEGLPEGSGYISWYIRLESQYRHSQLQLLHCPSWGSILEELILLSALTAGQYGKIVPSRLSNTGDLNFIIILFSNWEWQRYYL